jgi:hypothetical protein
MYIVTERRGSKEGESRRKHPRGSVTILEVPWLNLRFSISDHGYTITALDNQEYVVHAGMSAPTDDVVQFLDGITRDKDWCWCQCKWCTG